MTIENKKILLVIIFLNLALIPLVILTTGPIRITLGLLFIILFPGYTLISVLFPAKKDLDCVERLASSFGSSISLVPFIGLILNYTPWGIKLYPIIFTLSFFIIVTSVLGYFRQNKLPESERLNITINLNLANWTITGKLNRALSIFLLVTMLGALCSFGYAIANPKQGEKFTEFYIFGPDGSAKWYPQQVKLGESTDIIIGIINHEQETTNYRVKVKISDTDSNEINIGTLNNGEKIERKISILPNIVGSSQKVEFYLYLNDEQKPYFDNPIYLYQCCFIISFTLEVIDQTLFKKMLNIL